LHDLGRIGVSSGIWQKAGPLTEEEGDGDQINACGYNEYWGDRVAVPTRAQKGDGGGSYYFRFDVSKPHPILFVSLNTGPCAEVNALCARGSRLLRFLQGVLSSPELNPPESCTVVYYHHPAWDWHLSWPAPVP